MYEHVQPDLFLACDTRLDLGIVELLVLLLADRPLLECEAIGPYVRRLREGTDRRRRQWRQTELLPLNLGPFGRGRQPDEVILSNGRNSRLYRFVNRVPGLAEYFAVTD